MCKIIFPAQCDSAKAGSYKQRMRKEVKSIPASLLKTLPKISKHFSMVKEVGNAFRRVPNSERVGPSPRKAARS